MASEKTLNLKNLQERPIRTTLGSMAVLLTAAWALYRPFLIEDLSADFVTKAELTKQIAPMTAQLNTMQTGQDTQQAALDAMSTKIDVAAAFAVERAFIEDLNSLNAEKANPPTRSWLEKQRDLTLKRDLAKQYKNCLLKEEKNCELLQDQLWQ